MAALWTTKQECSKEPFFLDWSAFYARHGLDAAVDPITSSVWEVTGGTSGTEFIEDARTGIFIEGGTPGGAIYAKNTIEISGGAFRDCRTIVIGVK